MKTILAGLVALVLVLVSCGITSANGYNITGNLDVNDVNVFYSQLTNPTDVFTGNFNAFFKNSRASGYLTLSNQDNDLFVQWSSEAFGITITQNDNYAIKFIANAKVIRNEVLTYEPIYVNYNKLSNQIVIRGYGFRIATA